MGKHFKILGIRRAAQFSPNNTGNDGAIFSLTVKELEKRGHYVRQLTEEEFFHEDTIEEPAVFSMIRNKQNVVKLQQLEEAGTVVVNSGKGIENCFRSNLTKILISNMIAHPKSEIVETNINDFSFYNTFQNSATWIKRGDFHTVHMEDVTYCRNRENCENIIKEFALREIPTAVISEHKNGDLVKFYAVQDTPFFYWFYPLEQNHIKFGTISQTEKSKHYTFDVEELKKLASKSANALNIKIYGGDAIISSEGEICLIDVNDWPSFAPCREEASNYIADCIINSLN